MRRGCPACHVVLSVNFQTVVDQRVGTVVAVIHIEPVACGNQGRIQHPPLPAESVKQRAGVRAVVFIINPHRFPATAALVGVMNIGSVAEVEHAEGLRARVEQLVEQRDHPRRDFFREICLDPGIVFSVPGARQARHVGQLKLQRARADIFQGQIRPVEVQQHAVRFAHTLIELGRRRIWRVEPGGESIGAR